MEKNKGTSVSCFSLVFSLFSILKVSRRRESIKTRQSDLPIDTELPVSNWHFSSTSGIRLKKILLRWYTILPARRRRRLKTYRLTYRFLKWQHLLWLNGHEAWVWLVDLSSFSWSCKLVSNVSSRGVYFCATIFFSWLKKNRQCRQKQKRLLHPLRISVLCHRCRAHHNLALPSVAARRALPAGPAARLAQRDIAASRRKMPYKTSTTVLRRISTKFGSWRARTLGYAVRYKQHRRSSHAKYRTSRECTNMNYRMQESC